MFTDGQTAGGRQAHCYIPRTFRSGDKNDKGQCRVKSFSNCDRLESALLHTRTTFQCSWLNGPLVMEKVFEVFILVTYGHGGQFWSCDKAYFVGTFVLSTSGR